MLLAGALTFSHWLCQWGPISCPDLGRRGGGLRLQGAIGQIGSRTGGNVLQTCLGVDSLAVKWTDRARSSDLRTVCWMRTSQ